MGEKMGFFGKLVAGLQKTRDNIIAGVDSIFSGFSAIDDEFYEEIEEILNHGGFRHSDHHVHYGGFEEKGKKNRTSRIRWSANSFSWTASWSRWTWGKMPMNCEKQRSVLLVIGVNGVGKTTSVGKLAGQMKDDGKKVIVAAADTFRAAAIEQLSEVGQKGRSGHHRPAGGL